MIDPPQVRLQILIALVGIAVLAGLAFWSGLPSMERAFVMLGSIGFIFIVFIHVPLILLMGTAWWSISNRGRHAPLRAFIMARIARDSVSEMLPFSQLGGFAAGIRVLSLAVVRPRMATALLFADLLMEFLSKLLYAAVGVAMLMQVRPESLLLSYLLAGLFLLLAFCLLMLRYRNLQFRIALGLLRRHSALGRKVREFGAFLSPGRLGPSGVLHIICWSFGGIEAWLTFHLMGMAVTGKEALIIDSLAMGLRTFGFWVPAALGIQEGAYIFVCSLVGLGPDVAMALSLVRRGRDILLGIIGFSAWQGLEFKIASASSSGRFER
jgi:putative membrane protein